MKAERLIPAAAGVAAVILALASPALAAATPAAAQASGENTPLNLGGSSTAVSHGGSGGGSIVRTIVGLLIVIAVIYGVSWILRQVKGSRETRSSGRGLASVATLPLGTGRSLHLVRAGSELVLVGVAEHGVTPIRRYDEDEARAAGLLLPAEDEPRDGAGTPGSGGTSASGGWGSPEHGPTPLARLLDALRQWTVRS